MRRELLVVLLAAVGICGAGISASTIPLTVTAWNEAPRLARFMPTIIAVAPWASAISILLLAYLATAPRTAGNGNTTMPPSDTGTHPAR